MAFQPPPLNLNAASTAASSLTAGAISSGDKNNWGAPAGLFSRGGAPAILAQLKENPALTAALIIGLALLARKLIKG